ncbi:MAG: 30S ribosomal protein S1 [Armatimonadetes bacterium]|nr:30S ribosomal protein S1 [Armatimonadota bacterium]
MFTHKERFNTMSDETTGATTNDEATASPGVSTTPSTASATPELSGEGTGAATAATTETGGNDPKPTPSNTFEQMPPLDQIEVPGTENPSTGRNGRGRRGDDENTGEFRAGQVVVGTVVKIDEREGVLVDIGAKSEGIIRLSELSREPFSDPSEVVKLNDRVDVLILEPEGREGNILLSRKRAEFERTWDNLITAMNDGTPVMALVQERVKGGLVVDLGVRGFVPASHVGNGKLKNLDKFVGQNIPLKVLEVDRGGRKVVLSHRLATEEERENNKQATINALGEGQVRTGTIRRVTDYGAFVDLGGIDGLLHVSEMSWTRIKHPSDVVKVGQEVEVKVLKMNLDQGRVSLGMRDLLPDPWTTIGDKYHVGDTVEGEITRLVQFGAFVALEGGIEGIIPNSELANRRIAKPSDVVEEGQTLSIKIIDVRPDDRRITLSLRALQSDTQPLAPSTDGSTAEGDANRAPKRDRKRRGGEEEFAPAPAGGGGGGWGGNYSTGGGGGLTLGDMFGDMFSGGKAGKAGAGKKRGRRFEEEEEDLDNIDFDAEIEADAEETPEAETDETPDDAQGEIK